MIDIKKLRSNEDFQSVKTRMRRGVETVLLLEKARELDATHRRCLLEAEESRAKQNAASKEISRLKREGQDASELMNNMKTFAEKQKALSSEASRAKVELEAIMFLIPNIPDENAPNGKDDSENVEQRKWGTPRNFDFVAKPHWELGAELGILDPAAAAKIAGSRFTLYKGFGARLERALMNFMLDTHNKRGYLEVIPPFMVHKRSLFGTGQLPKFENDLFAIKETEYFLNPTAEVPLTNIFREEILREPVKICAYAPSFRAEAGSAGRDTRGLIRQHQFGKVELIKIVPPEVTPQEYEALIADAEHILQELELPYRVVWQCVGDLSFSAKHTTDLEVYMPSYERYVEISSCSDFGDFQARRAQIYFRDENGKTKLANTINGSGLALGRCTAAVLENYQKSDGSVEIPKVLRKYMFEDNL